MPLPETSIPVRDYDLAATLNSGQAFGWTLRATWWEGVIGSHWVRLQSRAQAIVAQTAVPIVDWSWLAHYLQTHVELPEILRSFPNDEPMRASVAACRGLRLLRQDPWECLASFIVSSTKQIVQIRQIVAGLCRRFGEGVVVPPGHEPAWAFPSAERLAAATEQELRACGMGFRAPYLLGSARKVARREIDLSVLGHGSVDEARRTLRSLPGVGDKVANCVLLFAYGYQEAFPVDVWVRKALRQLYFPRSHPKPRALARFVASHFGPHAGYAQQYLFHYMRLKRRR